MPSICSKLSGGVETYPELIDRLKSVSPCPITIEAFAREANGYYDTAENRIVVKAGMSEAQTVKTLVHEITHSILHSDKGEEKEAGRRKREVQAESVAYVVCSALGLDTAEYSFGYVAGWSAGQELEELTESMEVIRKTAKTILNGLEAA